MRIVAMDGVGTARGIFHDDHQTFLARKVRQVFRKELGYLSLLRYQRAGHETRQRQNQFCECHKLTFSLDRHNFNASCVLVGTSQLRVVPHEFLFGVQPIVDLVAVLLAT
jgi:hypothetical protein